MTRCDDNYFTDKYGMTRTHSEVVHAATIVAPGKTLDLGCGNGRNSLYLAANGFDVTAWDKNPNSIQNLENIRREEGLENLHSAIQDLNNLSFDGEYDFILSTVVLMFLEAKTIPGLIANMQRCTKPGGKIKTARRLLAEENKAVDGVKQHRHRENHRFEPGIDIRCGGIKAPEIEAEHAAALHHTEQVIAKCQPAQPTHHQQHDYQRDACHRKAPENRHRGRNGALLQKNRYPCGSPDNHHQHVQ